jgi:hypothetical protein
MLFFLIPLAWLFILIPPACFVLTVLAFAYASDPPAQASRNAFRTWKLLGASLLPLLLFMLTESVAPPPASSRCLFSSEFDLVCFTSFELLALGLPILLVATWFRGIAPSRLVRVLMSIVAISIGFWFALLELANWSLQGV